MKKTLFIAIALLYTGLGFGTSLAPFKKEKPNGEFFTKEEVIANYKAHPKYLLGLKDVLRNILISRNIPYPKENFESLTVNNMLYILQECAYASSTKWGKGEVKMAGIDTLGSPSFTLDRPSYSNRSKKIQGEEKVLFIDLDKFLELLGEKPTTHHDTEPVISLACQNLFWKIKNDNVTAEKPKFEEEVEVKDIYIDNSRVIEVYRDVVKDNCNKNYRDMSNQNVNYNYNNSYNRDSGAGYYVNGGRYLR